MQARGDIRHWHNGIAQNQFKVYQRKNSFNVGAFYVMSLYVSERVLPHWVKKKMKNSKKKKRRKNRRSKIKKHLQKSLVTNVFRSSYHLLNILCNNWAIKV